MITNYRNIGSTRASYLSAISTGQSQGGGEGCVKKFRVFSENELVSLPASFMDVAGIYKEQIASSGLNEKELNIYFGEQKQELFTAPTIGRKEFSAEANRHWAILHFISYGYGTTTLYRNSGVYVSDDDVNYVELITFERRVLDRSSFGQIKGNDNMLKRVCHHNGKIYCFINTNSKISVYDIATMSLEFEFANSFLRYSIYPQVIGNYFVVSSEDRGYRKILTRPLSDITNNDKAFEIASNTFNNEGIAWSKHLAGDTWLIAKSGGFQSSWAYFCLVSLVDTGETLEIELLSEIQRFYTYTYNASLKFYQMEYNNIIYIGIGNQLHFYDNSTNLFISIDNPSTNNDNSFFKKSDGIYLSYIDKQDDHKLKIYKLSNNNQFVSIDYGDYITSRAGLSCPYSETGGGDITNIYYDMNYRDPPSGYLQYMLKTNLFYGTTITQYFENKIFRLTGVNPAIRSHWTKEFERTVPYGQKGEHYE